MMTREDARAYAGSLAAASVVVSKRIPLRDPLLAGLPPRFRPSSLGDLSRLFGQDDSSPDRRLARLSSAALVYSVNKKDKTQPEKVLRDDERALLSALHISDDKAQKADRSCPHCRLLLSSVYADHKRWREFPPVGVVNHQARVDITFDPETNISEASIKDFQVIVPEAVAKRIIQLSHPLHWADPPGSLFRRSDPVEADGSQGEDYRADRATADARWEQRATAGEAFIFEDVGWPVNEQLSADAENVIKIFNFSHAPGQFLRYTYSLERCIRTNFGIAWEPSGLDIDGGDFTAHAVPLDPLCDGSYSGDIGGSISSQIGADNPLSGATRRDIVGLQAQQDPKFYEVLARGWPTADDDLTTDDVSPAELVKTVKSVADNFKSVWPEFEPFYFVTVGASKKLHFTIPEVGPIDLWQNLTFTAPAILFTFLNRAICHAPHLLVDGLVSQDGKVFHATGK
jgi:hypothetical protein